jgi:hypothetical protein
MPRDRTSSLDIAVDASADADAEADAAKKKTPAAKGKRGSFGYEFLLGQSLSTNYNSRVSMNQHIISSSMKVACFRGFLGMKRAVITCSLAVGLRGAPKCRSLKRASFRKLRKETFALTPNTLKTKIMRFSLKQVRW